MATGGRAELSDCSPRYPLVSRTPRRGHSHARVTTPHTRSMPPWHTRHAYIVLIDTVSAHSRSRLLPLALSPVIRQHTPLEEAPTAVHPQPALSASSRPAPRPLSGEPREPSLVVRPPLPGDDARRPHRRARVARPARHNTLQRPPANASPPRSQMRRGPC